MMISSGFISLIILGAIHLFANQAKLLGWIWHGRFLSFAAGISFAYVFVDLLPALEKGQPVLKRTFEGVVPYFDRHAYLIALLGVLFYYGLYSHAPAHSKNGFWIALGGYILFNFFVGASLSDSTNPDIQPLVLFTIAMGMHYFIRDHNAASDNMRLYESQARWWLVGALFAGYFTGYMIGIPNTVVALGISFIAGGIFLNAMRYELPKREKVGYACFVLGALLYTAIVMGVGN